MKESERRVLNRIVRSVTCEVELILAIGWCTVPDPDDEDVLEVVDALSIGEVSVSMAEDIVDYFQRNGHEETYKAYRLYVEKYCMLETHDLEHHKKGEVWKQYNYRVILSNGAFMKLYLDSEPGSVLICPRTSLMSRDDRESLQRVFYEIYSKISQEDLLAYLQERIDADI